VKSVLTDSKLILKFATLSLIESLRSNSELCNFIIYDNSNNIAISYGPNHTSLILSGGQQQQQSFNDIYTTLVLEEAEKLYNTLKTELTNRAIAATASIRASPLPSLGNENTNNQKLAYNIDNTYQTEESRYNNQNRNF
jgi:hypothetical protein